MSALAPRTELPDLFFSFSFFFAPCPKGRMMKTALYRSSQFMVSLFAAPGRSCPWRNGIAHRCWIWKWWADNLLEGIMEGPGLGKTGQRVPEGAWAPRRKGSLGWTAHRAWVGARKDPQLRRAARLRTTRAWFAQNRPTQKPRNKATTDIHGW